MSRGPGKLQRKIADIFRDNPSETFTLVQLAKLVYPGLNIAEKKHLNAISRAVYGVLGEKSWWTAGHCAIPGGGTIFYNLCDIKSYVWGRRCNLWLRPGEELREEEILAMHPGGYLHDHVALNIAKRNGTEPDPDIKRRQDKRNDEAERHRAILARSLRR